MTKFDAGHDETDDEPVDQLARELLDENISRYQAQASELLEKGCLKGELNGYHYEYMLDKNECSFRLIIPPSESMKEYARTYVHRKKSQKMEYIPLFFARCEATLFVD